MDKDRCRDKRIIQEEHGSRLYRKSGKGDKNTIEKCYGGINKGSDGGNKEDRRSSVR